MQRASGLRGRYPPLPAQLLYSALLSVRQWRHLPSPSSLPSFQCLDPLEMSYFAPLNIVLLCAVG